MASTANDIIIGALTNINAYSPGENLSAQDSTLGLNTLNDLLDSLSTDKCFIYTQSEVVYPWIANQFQYAVGNPVGGTFLGTISIGSSIITVTSIPAGLIANVTASLASDITDLQGLIPAGTTVTAASGISITLSAAAIGSSVGNDTFTFTTPGDIKTPRPLRFNDGFTRANTSGISNLDYSFKMVSFDHYKKELLKNVPGPWPYIAAYQPTFPLGTLYIYPAPTSSYTAHLFPDLILTQFATLTTSYSLPQGYTRALKKLLALELAPSYGKTPHPLLITQAKEAKELLKSLNASPVATLEYDSAIARSQSNDASWAQHGGFI